ncbi:MAG: N-acetylmuramoyl-L-alanine amidase [Streptosporangiales bacterium]
MSRPVRVTLTALAAAAPVLAFAAPAASASPSDEPASRQQAFAAAAQEFGVPRSVLLGVSYMESRWADHNGEPSTSGGYGPLHLTDVDAPVATAHRSGGPQQVRASDPALHTARLASSLTDVPVKTLESDPAENIRGGAAVLAHYQRDVGLPTGATTKPGRWYAAVAKYSGASTQATAESFANEVFATVRDGAARTVDGDRVRLAAHPGVQPRRGQADRLDLAEAKQKGKVDCPKKLGCRWLPAPYEQYGSSSGAYGNHDLANRQRDLNIDYIVIHSTEATWQTTLDLVQNPRYVSWQYTIRSSDGQIWQHVKAKDVAWQAGNWYVNMHSIGIEHEGFAAQGATWFTETMYRNSAALVRYLAHKYGVKIDRSHIIGHDQVPGITPAYVKGMHWDPGPYWNWEHYFKLLRHPIGRGMHNRHGGVVTIKPGFADNQQVVTGCGDDRNAPCAEQGTNFVYLHTKPSKDSPLVNDQGLHPNGEPSTTYVSDIGARAAAGAQYAYVGQRGDWTAVWYLGKKAWFQSPEDGPNAVRSVGFVVSPKKGKDAIPFYGRAYPEKSAYPDDIPYQQVVPLQYSLKAGQSAVLADRDIQTDYYRAVSYNVPGRDVVGQDKYYWVWLGHRMGFVRAADVDIKVALGN